jgi:hypothetical protein
MKIYDKNRRMDRQVLTIIWESYHVFSLQITKNTKYGCRTIVSNWFKIMQNIESEPITDTIVKFIEFQVSFTSTVSLCWRKISTSKNFVRVCALQLLKLKFIIEGKKSYWCPRFHRILSSVNSDSKRNLTIKSEIRLSNL